MLSSHMLEIETGRYSRTQREQRWCKACFLKTGVRVVGDETHSLTECVRAASLRETISESIASCFQAEQKPIPDNSSILDMLRLMGTLPYKKQQSIWGKVAKLTAAIRHHIKSDMESPDALPNKWMQLVRASQIKSLGAAAERYHRKKLRRQMRSMPTMPTIIVSDDDSSDVEIVHERPPLHPDPFLCNAIIF